MTKKQRLPVSTTVKGARSFMRMLESQRVCVRAGRAIKAVRYHESKILMRRAFAALRFASGYKEYAWKVPKRP